MHFGAFLWRLPEMSAPTFDFLDRACPIASLPAYRYSPRHSSTCSILISHQCFIEYYRLSVSKYWTGVLMGNFQKMIIDIASQNIKQQF